MHKLIINNINLHILVMKCPECETIFVNNVKICTECGYEFDVD